MCHLQEAKLGIKEMNELIYKVLLINMLVMSLIIIQAEGKVCYITQSSRDKIEDSGDDNVIQWRKSPILR